MDDFKNSTRTKYFMGGSVAGPAGAAQMAQTMAAFKRGQPAAPATPARAITRNSNAFDIARAIGRAKKR